MLRAEGETHRGVGSSVESPRGSREGLRENTKFKAVCVFLFCSAGKSDTYERCVSEAELLLDQSMRLEQAGEVAAALSAVNEAVCKLLPLPLTTLSPL